MRNNCDETLSAKAWATKTEHKETERESAGFLTHMPMACCKSLAVFIVEQPMRCAGDPGGANVAKSCFQGFIFTDMLYLMVHGV